MTTVAYRDGVLAADSLACSAETVTGRLQKLRRLPDGRMVAMLGKAGHAQRLVAWIEAGAEDAQPEGDCCVVVVDRGGVIRLYEDGACEVCSEAPFKAWGTGGCLAMGAMAMGASAKRAIEIACEFDLYTGAPVETLSLHTSDCAGR